MSPRDIVNLEEEVTTAAAALREAIRDLDYEVMVGRLPTLERLNKLLVQLRRAQGHIDQAAQADFDLLY